MSKGTRRKEKDWIGSDIAKAKAAGVCLDIELEVSQHDSHLTDLGPVLLSVREYFLYIRHLRNCLKPLQTDS